MTGYEIVERALVLLNYTTPQGDTDNGLNAEHLRRSLTILNTVLEDLLNVAGAKLCELKDLQEDVPLEENVAKMAAVPGVAMYLAQSENDGDSFNRWSDIYVQRRRMAAQKHGTVRDAVPWPIG